jgi:hypothetical protein
LVISRNPLYERNDIDDKKNLVVLTACGHAAVIQLQCCATGATTKPTDRFSAAERQATHAGRTRCG